MSFDQLCLNCHTASSGPYVDTNAPLVKTHSSDNTSNQYGEWSRECRDCHDPHYQKQKVYKNTDANNLYLATGIIDGCAYNGNGTSTLTYSSITYKPGWDAAKVVEKTVEYRRAILFPNISKLGFSYPVTGINEVDKEITVTGDARPVYQYISSSTFAMIYGQYVKENIEDRIVKFFDQTGDNSYSDGDTTYDGVCEVCHTQTKYHRNDGTGSAHYGGENCRRCHSHLDGLGHGGSGTQGECIECHGHDFGYEYSPGQTSKGKGTYTSHSTHTENDSDDLKGPYITCDVCHDTNQYPFFKSGTDSNGNGKYDLSETDVCDNCHSPNGAFDGVNDGVVGAKNNWNNGVYASPTLQAGKEKWCVGCHDGDAASETEKPANSKHDGTGAHAPKVAGDNTTYGFYATGHGRNEGNMVECLDCHDATARHIDHDQRTYNVVECDIDGSEPCSCDETRGWVAEPGHEYNPSYRLADVSSDYNGDTFDPAEPAMILPRKSWWESPLTSKKHHFRLCWKCHDKTKILGAVDYSTPGPPIDCSNTNFWNESFQRNGGPFNLHYEHLWRKSSYDCVNNQTGLHFFNSDWDIRWNCAQADSDASCTACHNVHGSPTGPMIRHGELVSPPGTTDLEPGFGFKYLLPGTGKEKAIFTPSPALANDTNYKVYAWWTTHANRAKNAKFIIYHRDGVDQVVVNQEINGNQWNLLGEYTFSADTGKVVLTSDGANEYIMADAVGWDQDGSLIHGAGTDPEIVMDDADAGCQGPWTIGDGGYNNTQRWNYAPVQNTSPDVRNQSFGGRMGMNGGNPWQNYICKL